MKSTDIKSVADHLLYTALKTPHPHEKAMLIPGVRDLAKSKRVSYDMTALEAVARSRETVTTPEILSHFKICRLPFDNMWLEGPHPALAEIRRAGSREGYMLKSLPDEGFSIQAYTIMPGAHKLQTMMNSRSLSLNIMTIGDMYIASNPSFNITINSKRIDLDDKNLEKHISEKKKALTTQLGISAQTPKAFELEDSINIFFDTADFIARMIIMMNSKSLGFGVENTKDRQEVENDKKIQSSLALKTPRTVDVRPIKIDLARVTTTVLETLRSGEPRDNQGITSVCGHMCYPKNRKAYWMPPHDRAKLLPGDNRSAERQLRSTKEQLALAIQGGVPTRIIQHAEESLKKLSM
jgi:hypothetical protein